MLQWFKQNAVLLLLITLSFTFRWYLIRNNHFEFYYYQARDAIISRSILEKRDLKIQGPATSGTNDTLYNGVLYYYIIGPLYTLSQGNPLIPSLFLAFLSSLAIVPIFLIGKKIFNNQFTSLFASVLYAFSTDTAVIGSWLSNPSLATWSVPAFYYCLWQSLFKKKKKFLPLTALFLGISNQATLYTAYLICLALIIYLYQSFKQKNFFFLGKKNFLTSSLIYLLSISTMILTQIKLLLNGVYQFSDFYINEGGKPSLIITLKNILNVYLQKAELSLLPSLPQLSTVLAITILILFLFSQLSSSKKVFFVLWIFSPFLMFLITARISYYSLTGLTPAIYLLLSYLIFENKRKALQILNLSLIAILFIFFNFRSVHIIRQSQSSILTVQNGAFLTYLLNLIDYTYQAADKQEFSISTLTSPYKYNTTWAYLYSWYGQQKYGYLPQWYGSDQAGITGSDLLEKTDQPQPIHFSIYESDPGWLNMFVPEFQKWQQSIAGSVKSQVNFGTLSLEQREK